MPKTVKRGFMFIIKYIPYFPASVLNQYVGYITSVIKKNIG